jgi:hypothetical protein
MSTQQQRADALEAAIKLLNDEANELALINHNPESKFLTHRAKSAISREITRLRDVSGVLDEMRLEIAPAEPDQPEE